MLRLVWVALFVIHLFPAAAVSVRFFKNPSLANSVSLLVLSGILTLAALKALDFAWLRIPLNRRSLLGIVLVAVWIHGDMLIDRLPDYITVESTLSFSVGIVAGSARLIKKLQAQLARLMTQQGVGFSKALDDGFIPVQLYAGWRQVSPRAPPIR